MFDSQIVPTWSWTLITAHTHERYPCMKGNLPCTHAALKHFFHKDLASKAPRAIKIRSTLSRVHTHLKCRMFMFYEITSLPFWPLWSFYFQEEPSSLPPHRRHDRQTDPGHTFPDMDGARSTCGFLWCWWTEGNTLFFLHLPVFVPGILTVGCIFGRSNGMFQCTDAVHPIWGLSPANTLSA